MQKKILYIDNRSYGHNADIHIEFISSLDNNRNFKIFGYGNYLSGYIKNFEKIPLNSINKKFERHEDINITKSNKTIDYILKRQRPDAILTYNSNGSGYEIEMDNPKWYGWLSDYLSKIDIPKYHITTDYCRNGYKKEQADWFKYVKYSAAIFRTRESLRYPIEVPAYCLPFSIDKYKYLKNIEANINKKKKLVGFIGAAHNSSKELYKNRIMAIDYLKSKNLINLTSCLDKSCLKRLVLTGSKYIKFLTNNMFNLTCGGTSNYMTAKYFQIPAAYSMLVCTDTNGLEMFPIDTFIKYSSDNIEELSYQIDFHIKNLNITKEKIDVLHKAVILNHNHNHRASQLLKIMNKDI